MYFNNISDQDALHAAYRQWSRRLHPDSGGSEEAFKQMRQEYEARCRQLAEERRLARLRSEQADDLRQIAAAVHRMARRRYPAVFDSLRAIADSPEVTELSRLTGFPIDRLLKKV